MPMGQHISHRGYHWGGCTMRDLGSGLRRSHDPDHFTMDSVAQKGRENPLTVSKARRLLCKKINHMPRYVAGITGFL